MPGRGRSSREDVRRTLVKLDGLRDKVRLAAKSESKTLGRLSKVEFDILDKSLELMKETISANNRPTEEH